VGNRADSTRKVSLVVGAAFCGAAVFTCVWLVLDLDASLSRLQRQGSVRVGYAVEAPYAFLTSVGEVTGESPEIAARMAARLGIARVDWRGMEFGALIDELEAGHIDVIAAGLFRTPERARRVCFSLPTLQVCSGLLVAKGNPLNLHAERQLVTNGAVRLAVLSGSIEEQRLIRSGVEARRLVGVPDALTGKAAVVAGVADALPLSLPSVKWMAKQGELKDIEWAQPFEPLAEREIGYAAFAFRKRDRRLRTAWDRALSGFLSTPEHQSLIARFGLTAADVPVPPAGCREESE